MMPKTHYLVICFSVYLTTVFTAQTGNVVTLGPPIQKPVAHMAAVQPSLLTAKRLSYNWNHLKFAIQNSDKVVNSVIVDGTGFPNDYPPKFLMDALTAVVNNRTGDAWLSHQYTKCMGDPKLTSSIANFFSPLFHRQINPNREVLITAGAIQALDTSVRAFVDPGDEVIIFEPAYFMFEPIIRLSNGVPVYIPLRPAVGTTGKYSQDWTFNVKELENAINSRTKMILLNNPNNPYGKMFTLQELTIISKLAIKHNLIVVADEVQQFLMYDQTPHIRIATLPGMWERTITITSGGKMFGNTGWRLGWSIGPAELLWGPAVVESTETLNAVTPVQLAVSAGLDYEGPLYKANDKNSYLRGFIATSKRNRDVMAKVFEQVGTDYIVPAGGYSINANFTRLAQKVGLTNLEMSADKMAKWLYDNAGIDGMPVSTFYQPHAYGSAEYVIRFIIIKKESLIDELAQRIVTLFNKINKL